MSTHSNIAVVLKSNGTTVRGRLVSVSPCHIPKHYWIRVDTGEEVHTVYRTDTLREILFDPHSLKTITYSNGERIYYLDMNGKKIVVRIITSSNSWNLEA